MTSIFDPEHPHYEVHRDFVEGGFANPKNPPQIESSIPGGLWYLNLNPTWDVNTNYRIKPRVMTRTVTYPEPMQWAPTEGTDVWVVMADAFGPIKKVWNTSIFFAQLFNNGMCFTTEDDAQACYDALFGEQK